MPSSHPDKPEGTCASPSGAWTIPSQPPSWTALDRVVEGMAGPLRPRLGVNRAAALLRALCRAEVYRGLVEESSWSPDEYEAWLVETLKRQLLPSAGF